MLSVYGASQLRPRRVRGGHRRRRPAGRSPVLVSVFLEGGIDALSVLAPVDRPDLPPAAPEARAPPGAGAAFDRGPAAAVATRRRRRSRQLHGEGKVTVLPAIGYDERRPVPLHLAPLLGGRRARPDARTGWLGRCSTRRQRDNPLQGLSLDGSLSPALATASVPGRGDRRALELRPLGARASGASSRS